jgi:hypothetical protein
VPALTGYLDKADRTKITSDARTGVEAIQTWALSQYADGVVGNDALFDAAGGNTPANNGVSFVEEKLYHYEMQVRLEVSGPDCPDLENPSQEASNLGGVSVRLADAWTGSDSIPNTGLYAKAWIDGKTAGGGAVDVSGVPGSNSSVSLSGYESIIDGSSFEIVVVLGDQSIGAMDYTTAKQYGAVRSYSVNVDCDQSVPITFSGVLPISDTKVVHYDATQITPGGPQWESIVDELAATDWTSDADIEIIEVTFDEANKVRTMIIKVGDQTCTYADGAYTMS